MEKDLLFCTLLDYYGAALTERQRELLTFYYDDDLSLFEIAENTGIFAPRGRARTRKVSRRDAA